MKKHKIILIISFLICLSSCKEMVIADAWTGIIDNFEDANSDKTIDSATLEEEEKELGIIRSDGLKYRPQDGKYHIFGYYENRKNFVIPDTFNNQPVTAITWFAFENCKSLQSITIGKNIDGIGKYAFRGCSNLVSFNIDENNSAVFNDGGLIYTGNENTKSLVFCLPNVTGEISFRDDIVEIEDGVFSEAPKITKIKIGSGAMISSFVRSETFDMLDSLQAFEVDDENPSLTDLNGVLCTRDEKKLLVFPGGRDGNYTIPESIVEVELHAFEGKKRLNSLSLNSQISNITFLSFIGDLSMKYFEVPSSNSYFSSYKGLVYSKQFDSVLHVPFGLDEFDFYPGVKTIASYAFQNEKEIQFLDLPRSIEKIENHAFYAPNLKSIVFGPSLKTIGSYAFYWANDIEKMFFEGTIEDLTQVSLSDCNSSLVHAKRYYYSEEKPKNKGRFWHYVNGKVVIW